MQKAHRGLGEPPGLPATAILFSFPFLHVSRARRAMEILYQISRLSGNLACARCAVRARPPPSPGRPSGRLGPDSAALFRGTSPTPGEREAPARLTWSFTPHSPAERSAAGARFIVFRAARHYYASPAKGRAGLTPKPHHAHQPRVGLRGSFRPRLASTFNHRPGRKPSRSIIRHGRTGGSLIWRCFRFEGSVCAKRPSAMAFTWAFGRI